MEEQRLAAYREAIDAAGMAVRPDYIRLGRYYEMPQGSGPGTGARRCRRCSRLGERPTAVFATCDVLAAGALQALQSARIRVPDEMSLIGFDDTLAINLAPALTTVVQPMHLMALRHFGWRWRSSAVRSSRVP